MFEKYKYLNIKRCSCRILANFAMSPLRKGHANSKQTIIMELSWNWLLNIARNKSRLEQFKWGVNTEVETPDSTQTISIFSFSRFHQISIRKSFLNCCNRVTNLSRVSNKFPNAPFFISRRNNLKFHPPSDERSVGFQIDFWHRLWTLIHKTDSRLLGLLKSFDRKDKVLVWQWTEAASLAIYKFLQTVHRELYTERRIISIKEKFIQIF